ncbi:MAG: hypothetical protein ACFFD7_00220 [Candidatus Thorarchaeota archaeon]
MSEFEQKILKLLEDITKKLDILLKRETATSTATTTVSSSASTPVATPEPRRPKPSELVERQKEEERLKEKPPVEGRRVCPQCGGTAFNTIEDKSQVLHQMGGVKIYAKKYICKSCGAEA